MGLVVEAVGSSDGRGWKGSCEQGQEGAGAREGGGGGERVR